MKRNTDTAAPVADAPCQVDQAGTDQANADRRALDAGAVADLEAIARDAAALEGGGDAPGAPGAAPMGPSTGEQLAMILKASRMSVMPLAHKRLQPEHVATFANIWDDDQVDKIAQTWGVVFDINGWTLGGAMDKWGPYVMAAMATVPPVYATYELVQEVKAQAAEAARRDRAGQAGPQQFAPQFAPAAA